MIGPVCDTNGNLKGVLQFLNKSHGVKIDEFDVGEVQSLLPALAEIINTVEVVKRIGDISCGIEEYMVLMKQCLFDNADMVDNTQ